MTETVLVIGGTGELGAPVARQLHADGYRVRLLARTLPAARDRDADLEHVQGDLDDTQSLSSALAGVGRLTYLSHMLAAPDAGAPALRAKFHASRPSPPAPCPPPSSGRRSSWRPSPARSAAPGRSSSADNPTRST